MSNPILKKILFLGAVAILLSSCGQESAPPPIMKAAVKPAVAAPGADKTAGVAVTAVEAKLRNPFLSYILVRRETEGMEKKTVRGPLQCCEISVFKIQAIMTSGKNPKVMLLAPDGKRYMVGIGDTIGTQDGKIIKIDEKGLLIREYTKDSEGKVVLTNDVVLRLHADKDK